ncbi:indolepyruvate oxidoreductase subunit beta [Acidaminobacter hydrogenoformans]|uniref:Indolepyruvate ferredoxin oxidoreductase beta subunit n=1 Tax=Acidaminobacter hydrogenoformans DSM 2784 TaxID=1120920 RepID=A0A1G5RQX2_9FIRM|nr:indolepyruvate oxidoreductase subunit beta [Acidaminobacter hydrogenoformans]SCZ76260.1 indolepyruvate ferredoxin oxidoreductase beta subunit [Acidaminobacter hydrogenoformans DSM 2784]
MTKNIMLGGVGGQGLVMTTAIISEAAFRAGFDVKTNDVIGLSQRGGKVWGSVRYGEEVFSPNIMPGQADVLLALEPLEGLRWSGMVKAGGVVLLNTSRIPPVPVIAEKAAYPEDIEARIAGEGEQAVEVRAVNALEEARGLGNVRVVNTVTIGMLSVVLEDIPVDCWHQAIEAIVPEKTLALNLKAFELGREIR